MVSNVWVLGVEWDLIYFVLRHVKFKGGGGQYPANRPFSAVYGTIQRACGAETLLLPKENPLGHQRVTSLLSTPSSLHPTAFVSPHVLHKYYFPLLTPPITPCMPVNSLVNKQHH